MVIGAGSAGCVIAHRLASGQEKTMVLVIDAGSSDDSPLFRRPGMLALIYQVPQLKEKSDWGYKTTPQRPTWTAGRCIPGREEQDHRRLQRRERHALRPRQSCANYDAWRDPEGNDGWGYDDVLPYFKESPNATKTGSTIGRSTAR